MGGWAKELSFAVRRLTRAPFQTFVIWLVIGTGVAFGTAILSLASAVARQAIPYRAASQLVRLSERNDGQGIQQMQSSVPALEHWRERTRALSSVGGVLAPINLNVRSSDTARRVLGGVVDPALFETLGVEPTLGRAFAPDEAVEGRGGTAVIVSHELWTEEYGARPDVLGRSMDINGSTWQIIGVLPPATPLDPMRQERIDVWFALGNAPTLLGRDVFNATTYRGFSVYGRMAVQGPATDLDDELRSVSSELFERYPESHDGWSWQSEPLLDAVTESVRAPLLTLAVAAAFLLLVCIANAGALLAQRARDATPGAGIRYALGADEQALGRWAAAELMLLCLPPAAGGLAIGSAALAARDAWMPFPIPPHVSVSLEPRVAAVLGIGAVVAVWVAAHVARHWWMKRASSVSVVARGPRREGGWARLGLGLQMTAATALTVTGLLTLASLAQLREADTGMDTARLLTLRLDVPPESRGDAEVSPLADEAILAVQRTPGVSEAALWSPHVPGEAVWYSTVRVEGRPDLREDGDLPLVRINQIGVGATEVLGLRLVEGSSFTSQDRQSGRRVALVSATAAREWWGSESAVGRRIQRWNHDEWSTVVGVVADVPLSGRQGDGSDFTRDVYFMHDQDPLRYLVVLARLQDDAPSSVAAVTAAVQAAVPDLPVYDVRFMEDILRDQERIARSSARLGGIFAVVALILVAVGLAGALSVTVSRRTREIGVRRALGAPVPVLVRQVTAPVWSVWGVSVAVGLLGSWSLLPRMLETTLYQVEARSVGYYLAAVVILLLVASPGIIGPTFRGAARAPASVLRDPS